MKLAGVAAFAVALASSGVGGAWAADPPEVFYAARVDLDPAKVNLLRAMNTGDAFVYMAHVRNDLNWSSFALPNPNPATGHLVWPMRRKLVVADRLGEIEATEVFACDHVAHKIDLLGQQLRIPASRLHSKRFRNGPVCFVIFAGFTRELEGVVGARLDDTTAVRPAAPGQRRSQ